MRIARIEAFQVQWRPDDPPSARSAFVRVWSDDGRCGLGEASPMQGGLASLVILKHHIAPAIVGADPLDHAVIQDRLLHKLVKLGPEGALTRLIDRRGSVREGVVRVERPNRRPRRDQPRSDAIEQDRPAVDHS